MTALWIVFVVSALVFCVLFWRLIQATKKHTKETSKPFHYVKAGGEDDEEMETVAVNVPLSEHVFLDKEGRHLNVEEYDGYLVKGNSMELANIKDGDMLLTSHGFKFDDNTPLPNIFVLKREHYHENQPQYKLRRVWALAYLSKINLEDVVRGIMAHPEFSKLKNHKSMCLDDNQMWEEFFGLDGRLAKYKKDHPNWNSDGNEEERVIISTTLRKEHEGDVLHTENGKHISFSIHPSKLVAGQVAYVYSPKNSEAE